MPNNIFTLRLVDIALIDPDNLAGVKPPVGIRFKTAEYAWRLDGRCYWGWWYGRFFPCLLQFGFSCRHELVQVLIGKFDP